MRNMVRIAITGELIQSLVTNGETTDGLFVEEGLPADAQFTHSAYDPASGLAYLFYTHPSFAPVRTGERVPEILPLISKRYSGETDMDVWLGDFEDVCKKQLETGDGTTWVPDGETGLKLIDEVRRLTRPAA